MNRYITITESERKAIRSLYGVDENINLFEELVGQSSYLEPKDKTQKTLQLRFQNVTKDFTFLNILNYYRKYTYDHPYWSIATDVIFGILTEGLGPEAANILIWLLDIYEIGTNKYYDLEIQKNPWFNLAFDTLSIIPFGQTYRIAKASIKTGTGKEQFVKILVENREKIKTATNNINNLVKKMDQIAGILIKNNSKKNVNETTIKTFFTQVKSYIPNVLKNFNIYLDSLSGQQIKGTVKKAGKEIAKAETINFATEKGIQYALNKFPKSILSALEYGATFINSLKNNNLVLNEDIQIDNVRRYFKIFRNYSDNFLLELEHTAKYNNNNFKAMLTLRIDKLKKYLNNYAKDPKNTKKEELLTYLNEIFILSYLNKDPKTLNYKDFKISSEKVIETITNSKSNLISKKQIITLENIINNSGNKFKLLYNKIKNKINKKSQLDILKNNIFDLLYKHFKLEKYRKFNLFSTNPDFESLYSYVLSDSRFKVLNQIEKNSLFNRINEIPNLTESDVKEYFNKELKTFYKVNKTKIQNESNKNKNKNESKNYVIKILKFIFSDILWSFIKFIWNKSKNNFKTTVFLIIFLPTITYFICSKYKDTFFCDFATAINKGRDYFVDFLFKNKSESSDELFKEHLEEYILPKIYGYLEDNNEEIYDYVINVNNWKIKENGQSITCILDYNGNIYKLECQLLENEKEYKYNVMLYEFDKFLERYEIIIEK